MPSNFNRQKGCSNLPLFKSKTVTPALLEPLLEIVLSNPITTYIYTLLLLIICNKYLVPIEKNLFKKLHII